MQTQIQFETHEKENNEESQKILDDNKDHFSTQSKIVYQLLKQGKRLTVRDAMINHGIGDLRRRIKDLKDYNKITIKCDFLEDKRTKVWYL